MESKVVEPVYARPVGVLESLGDALSAAFDEEMELWREVAQSYCSPLRTDPQQRYNRDGRRRDGGVQLRSVDTSDGTMSQSEASVDPEEMQATSEGNGRDDSLADKWEEVEELLAAIRPGQQQQQQRSRRSDRVVPLRRLMEVTVREPMARRRVTRCNDDLEDRVHTLQVCQRMLWAWAALGSAQSKSRDLKLAAEHHWHQSKCRSSFSRWRQFCRRQQFLRESSHAVTRLAQTRQLSSTLHHWWTIRRWSRGERVLKAWRDERRKRESFVSWLEIVEMSREIKRIRSNALFKRVQGAWAAWTRFVVEQKSNHEVYRLEIGFRLGRYFRFFAAGIRLSRARRVSIAISVKHHQAKVYRRVFHGWIDYNTRQRRMNMAVEWWTHCVLSQSFEAWNLLHRCFVYRNRQNLRARTCYKTCLVRNAVNAWRKLVLQRRQQRIGLARLVVRRLQRVCFRHLQSAVAADRTLSHQLQQWKIRRHLLKWRIQAMHRVLITNHRHEVQAIHRVRMLHQFAWRLWRDAYESRLRVKRLITLAEQNVLRVWWRRWTDYGMIGKASRAILQIVDVERNYRQQRLAVRCWRRFCSSQIELKAAHSISTRHYDTSILKTNLQRWRMWLCARRKSCARVADAEELFIRHCLRRWRTRASNQKKQNDERADSIVKRHPLWLKRVWFVTWQRNAKRQVRERVARLFKLWQQFVMRAHQDRQAESLAHRIQLTQSWRRWTALRAMNIRIREQAALLESSARSKLLHKALIEVWRTKTTRFIAARRKIQKIGATTTVRYALQRWKKQIDTKKLRTQATEWYHRCIRLKILRSLHNLLILRPLQLTRDRENKRKRRIFDAWATEANAMRRLRRATTQLNQWRARQTMNKLLVRWKSRLRNEELARSAASFHRQRLRRLVFDVWLRFTASRLTCREASEQIIFSARQRIFKSWQRALARQLFVYELEAHFDHALLQQAWAKFRDAVHQKQSARREWVKRLSSVLLRKMIQRWRHLVEVQNVQLLVASSRASKVHTRLVAQVFDEWTHFVSIRAFVAVRQRREALSKKTISMRHWKLYALLRYRERRRQQRLMLEIFSALKRHAIISEASREIQYRSYQSTLATAWMAWRLEFWIKQSHTTTESGLLRQCFEAWRSQTAAQCDIQQEERVQYHTLLDSSRRDSVRQMTAFAEATMLQHTVRRQRLMMQRVVHAWALAAQTCKRQRLRDGTKRRLSYARRLSMDSSQKQHDEFLENEDQENVSPNLKRTTSSFFPFSAHANQQEAELLELENWSSRLLKSVFDEWRSCVRSSDV